MNHYEKLTIIILRIAGCGLTLFTLVGIGWGFLINSYYRENPGYFFIWFAPYLITGIALFALSKPLAALIARKL